MVFAMSVQRNIRDWRVRRLCKIRRQCANAWRPYYVKQRSRGHAGRGVRAFSESLLNRWLRPSAGGQARGTLSRFLPVSAHRC